MTSSNIALKATELNVHRGDVPVLRRLSFSLKKGKVVGLLGPSGCGKTTLMRTIVGVQAIKKGSLEVLDSPAGHASLRAKVGYVTQSPSAYGDITVWQNLRYFGKLIGASKEQISHVLEEVQLGSFRNQLANDLSGGQQARLSLAIALLGRPQLLILDEPTVGLDPLLRRDLWKLFRSYASKGVTLLISSHVMDEADRCDEILLMREGRLLAQGTRRAILKQARKAKTIEETFIQLVEKDKEGHR